MAAPDERPLRNPPIYGRCRAEVTQSRSALFVRLETGSHPSRDSVRYESPPACFIRTSVDIILLPIAVIELVGTQISEI